VDLRLANGLDPKLNFAQQKQISVVDGKQPFVIADITSARLETCDSLARVYSLYVTLSNNPNLIEFGFLMNWPNLKPEEKRTQYSKYACHELHFFLYHKDPEFFRTVVQPFLKNKKDKQFLDHWLVGDDLAAYAQPWNYAQLNATERILLSQRVAADRQHTIRDTADRFALIPPDVERFNTLFETALKGSALETGDALGINKARETVDAVRLLARTEQPAVPMAGFGASATPAAPTLELANLSSAVAGAPAKPEGKTAQLKEAEKGALAAHGRRSGGAELQQKKAEDKVEEFLERDAKARTDVRQLYRS